MAVDDRGAGLAGQGGVAAVAGAVAHDAGAGALHDDLAQADAGCLDQDDRRMNLHNAPAESFSKNADREIVSLFGAHEETRRAMPAPDMQQMNSTGGLREKGRG
ncbi:hypothetical protein OHA72_25925 [Dactylosporangium sp. NBC_01737]|uniref:hypothetical protein n=1 Tax=Dactylosporangium sp. NBC_01737 TaxID=2975959 RepID=UPI002E1192EA|nr:hypothetical protein OHA72_25925 [Dactylosporangium sp. NBC_01737]